METYHRKRSKSATIGRNNEIICLKRKEMSSCAQAQTSNMDRQLLIDTNDEVMNDVELGSVYEIYHKNLPPRTPVQLRSTRVVMVSEKTELNVAIRYPSILSLQTYFSHGISEMYPALDEKFVMGIKLASKVLLRQVPSKEFAEKKHLKGFWLVNSNPEFGSRFVLKNEDIGLARELKNNKILKWGVRRQVTFVGRPKDTMNMQNKKESNNHEVKEVKKVEVDDDADQDDDDEVEEEESHDDDDDDDGDDDDDDIKNVKKSTRNLRKRKKLKQANHLWQVNKKPMNKCKKLTTRDPTDRWSKERYMAAELSLLEAMKEKKAIIGNPITRPALRIEARKRIGDTGLLDHLLKHVANKVAPGGTLRFRRLHNADGAMEYWLENADLLKIRKDAGVTDPFWTPPPGWKPGDSPIQDPIIAKEISHLKEEISYLKREYLPKKQHEEEIASLKREIQELKSMNKHEKSQDMVVSELVDKSPKKSVMDICNFLLNSSESEITTDVDDSKEKNKKPMLVISDFLKKIESEVGKETRSPTELMSESEGAEKESEKQKVMSDKNEGVALRKESAGDENTSARKAVPTAGGPPLSPEGKAAKIERLKSGFRLCRPQGSFLWPNMVNPTTTASSASCPSLQVEDFLVVPTPPSVNSSTPPQLPYHHHHLASPTVKPVPERRPVTVTVSEPPSINLNDIPTATSPTTIKLVASGVKNDPFKKRKISSSSSCLTNTVTPPVWL